MHTRCTASARNQSFGSGSGSEHSHALRALRTFLQSDPRSRGHRALLGRVFGRTHAQVPVDTAIDQLVASEEPVIGFKECPVSQPYSLLHRSAQMVVVHVVIICRPQPRG